ncbi:MAG: leucine-rich repeat domain-containing protein [Sedimentisphaerales bacterium]|nr:leucine-rich repeat domain-containing protein [Sedimentisphaerales bacterium]
MNNNETLQKEIRKSSRLRYIIAAVVIPLLLITALVFMMNSYDQSSDPVSEKIIRGVAAALLSKDANDLNNEDFQTITALHLNNKRLSDIKLLGAFTNLQVLDLSGINFPKRNKPKWKVFLEKWGIFNFLEKAEYDLSPLKKLSKLQILILSQTPVKNIEPLANLTNLRVLKINGTQVDDLEPLMRLNNLQELHILGIKKSDIDKQDQLNSSIQGIVTIYDKFSDEQLQNLKKALPNLKIIDSGVIFLI